MESTYLACRCWKSLYSSRVSPLWNTCGTP